MIKLPLLILPSILFLSCVAFAQTSPRQGIYQTNLEGYRKQLDSYYQASNEYELNRSKYLEYKTIVSEQSAFNSTKVFLDQTCQTIISYLNLLKITVEDTRGFSVGEQDDLLGKIAQDLSLYQDLKRTIPEKPNLASLVDLSNILDQYYQRTFSQSSLAVSYIYGAQIYYAQRAADNLYQGVREEVWQLPEGPARDALSRRLSIAAGNLAEAEAYYFKGKDELKLKKEVGPKQVKNVTKKADEQFGLALAKLKTVTFDLKQVLVTIEKEF